MNNDVNNLPEQYRPLSPWAYFGLQLRFCVPVVGLVFLIVFSISRGNINRRNFARSYFCVYAIVGIFLLICLLTGGVAGLLDALKR